MNAFVAAYLFSGAAALIYQVTWSRLLTLHLGNTVAAVGTVLAAFMGGLAVGAAVAGRASPRLTRTRALVAYGALELAIAGAAALLPFAIAAFAPALRAAYASGAGAWFGPVRAVTALLLITAPAAAMGATLPFAVRWYVADARVAGRDTGTLYAANTFGAVAGAALAGFVLLPAFGLVGTTAVAMLLNGAAAMIAFALARMPVEANAARPADSAAPSAGADRVARRGSRRARPVRPRPSKPRRPSDAIDLPYGRSMRLWLAASALCVSGFVALVYEVVWTRVFALVLGPTTYAFSAMLVAFIGGLAVGATVAARAAPRIRHPDIALATTLAATAVAAMGASWLVPRAPLVVGNLVARPDVTFGWVLFVQSAGVAALLLPMTCALGAAFPIAIDLAAVRNESLSRDVSTVYALNTLGAVSGALAGSFLLLPTLGLERSLATASMIGLVASATLLSAARRFDRAALPAIALICVGALLPWIAPGWSPALLSSGAYKYAPFLKTGDLQAALSAGTLEYYREGAAGTVSVRQAFGARSLAIDGKVDASDAGDMLTQKLLAHLPLLMHLRPRDVAIIGLGSGVTLGSALLYPVRRVDVLEISREVVEASRLFGRENRNGLADPRTRLIVGDGRTHATLTRDVYDVIISEPSNPWMAGVASLFTREFFASVRQRLREGGIFCQWAHTYDISDRDLRTIAATFLSEFPSGMLWQIGEGDLLLVAAADPPERSLARVTIAMREPAIASDLQDVGIQSAFELLSLFVASGRELERFVAGARIETDARMALEFSAPRSIYGATRPGNLAPIVRLAAAAKPPEVVARAVAAATPADWVHRGEMHLKADAHDAAYKDFERALRDDPQIEAAYDGLARAAAAAEKMKSAIDIVRAIVRRDEGNTAARRALSRLLFATGDGAGALVAAREAVRRAPADAAAQEQLASVLADLGDPDGLADVVAEMIRTAPRAPATRYFDAALHFLRGDFAGALERIDGIERADRHYAKARNLAGAAAASLGDTEAARRAFAEAARHDPADTATLVNAGQLELRAGNREAAVRHFAEALVLDASSEAARTGLADALEQQGHTDRARRLRVRQ